jgi:hypothetical protein
LSDSIDFLIPDWSGDNEPEETDQVSTLFSFEFLEDVGKLVVDIVSGVDIIVDDFEDIDDEVVDDVDGDDVVVVFENEDDFALLDNVFC